MSADQASQLSLTGQLIKLLPGPALFLQSESVLVIADTHFGKSASLRQRGIAVPDGELRDDLTRIEQLITSLNPARLVIAGDLLHARDSPAEDCATPLLRWLDSLDPMIEVATGNHDRKAGRLDSPGIVYHDRIEIGGLDIIHEPERALPGRPSICGHLHPVIKLRDGRNTRLRFPCFWLRQEPRQLVLPSFGSLTGGQEIQPTRGDRVFCALRGKVSEIPSALLMKSC